jgi:hypothetical protein
MNRIIVQSVLVSLLGAFAFGCGAERKEALEGVRQAEELCRRNKPDEAREVMAKVAEHNDTLKRAFSFATSGLGDRANVNPCGHIMTQIKGQLEN